MKPRLSTTPGAYRPGAAANTPRVAAQLAERRESVHARWKRDPGRELSLLLLFVLALVTIGVGAVAARTQTFAALGRQADDTFWMESAQRFRYVRMVESGEGIPTLDRRMQAPEGYPPRQDTIAQEEILGRLARRRPPEESVAAATRRWTRIVAASSALPLALLCLAVTRRRDAALLAALVFSLALPVVERGNGAVLFREDFAFPVLLWHLAFLARFARAPTWINALLAGLGLAAALLLWKVVQFHALLLVLFLAGALVLRRAPAAVVARGAVGLFLPAVLASLLPFNLRYEQFASSTPVLAAGAIAIGALLAARAPSRPRWIWVAVMAALFVAARLLLPREAGFDHAWETIVAKLRHADQKPADPALLSFHARHYWTGNYESPTWQRLLRDWPLLALLALPGVVTLVRSLRHAPSAPLRPPPSKLLAGDGPLDPLPPLLVWFVVWMAGTFLAVFLLFAKLTLFAAAALAVLAALGFAAPRRLRSPRRLLGVLLAGAIALQGLGALPTAEVLFPPADDPTPSEVVVFSSGSLSELSTWIASGVGHDDPVLASFVLSPFLLTYLDVPTVLHCFFEGDLLPRLQEVILARFGPEAGLWEVARKYGARYYIHEAHQLLRTDLKMSERYVADQLAWPATSVLASMSYAPESLEHFELAHENRWFRVFRVLEPGTRPAPPPPSLEATWSRPLFAGLFGDPLGPARAEPLLPGISPEDLLYSTLAAETWERYADTQRAPDDPRLRFAEQEFGLQRAVSAAPYLVGPHRRLAELYAAVGKPERAAEHRELGQRMAAVLAGRRAVTAEAAPTPRASLP